MDVLKKGKSERDSESVEDGRASTKVSNGDGEQETGEEEDAATQACTDGKHRIGQDELDAGNEENEEGDDEDQEDGEKEPKRFFDSVWQSCNLQFFLHLVLSYQGVKRGLHRCLTYVCRCDERLKAKAERYTRLAYSGSRGELEHLKIETRLIDERFCAGAVTYTQILYTFLKQHTEREERHGSREGTVMKG
jgi:hypothetical protein